MKFNKASLIISIYNNTTFLKAVLDSVQLQTDKRFEVIISEDAHHPEVVKFLKEYNYKGDFYHLTQPDDGWRKNRALNRAVAFAKTDYLVFIDGDCVLHPRFMEFHLKLAHPSVVLAGKRIKLDRKTSELLLKEPSLIPDFQTYLRRNFMEMKKAGSRYVEEGFFINPKGLMGFIPKLRSMYQLKGCNMSFSKEAILKINGFDEDYVRPATGEDADLLWRFQGLGYKIGSVRNLAVQYHLHHRESSINQDENLKLMYSNIARKKYVCTNGIDQHLKEAPAPNKIVK